MPRLPRIAGPEAHAALRRLGWYDHHAVGSHRQMRHPDQPGLRVTVPMHAGAILKPKTLRSIINSAGLTVDEFTAAL